MATAASYVGGFLLATCVIYAGNGEVLQYLGMTGATPVELLWLAHLMGLLLTPVMIWWWKDVRAFVTLRFALQSVGMAALLLAYNVLWLMSAARLPVRTTNLLFQTTIVLTPLGAALCGLEQLTAAGSAAAVLAIFGVTLAAGPSACSGEATTDGTGVLLGLGAAVGNTVYSLLWRTFGQKTASFVAAAYWAIAAVHLLAIPAYPFAVSHDLVTPFMFPATRVLQALMILSAILASSVNMLNIFIIAKAGAGVLAVGSAMSIPIAYVMDFIVHGESPAQREITGCIFIMFALVLTLSRPDLTWESAQRLRKSTVKFAKQISKQLSDLAIDESGSISPKTAVARLLSSYDAKRSTSVGDLEKPLLSDDPAGSKLAAAA